MFNPSGTNLDPGFSSILVSPRAHSESTQQGVHRVRTQEKRNLATLGEAKGRRWEARGLQWRPLHSQIDHGV